MNNSPDRVFEDVIRLLVDQVLPRLDEEAVRSQVFAAVFMIETLRLRTDWASEPLVAQIRAQDALFAQLAALGPALPALPAGPRAPEPCLRGQDLLALRDAGDAVIAGLVSSPGELGAEIQVCMDAMLAAYVRLELELEPAIPGQANVRTNVVRSALRRDCHLDERRRLTAAGLSSLAM